MKYIKKFESFTQPPGTGKETFWEVESDGQTIRITLDDIIDLLDNGFEIDPNSIKHLLIDTKRDKKRINSVDLNYPIILLKSKGDIVSILDGQHRILKAIEDKVNIKARVLDLDTAPDEFKMVFKK